MASSLELIGVTVEFDGRPALVSVSLKSSSKSIAVLGSNGSGKSTFARLLNGLAKPGSGQVSVLGQAPSTKNTGLVFSNPDLQVVMPTVFEDVAFSLSNHKLDKAQKKLMVLAALKTVGLEDLADANCQSLSSGQKQLLAMASTIVREPEILVLDEPTTLLDLANSKLIETLIHKLPTRLMVLVTHDLELAAGCEETLWFENGTLKDQGKPSEIIAAYRKYHR